MRRAVAAVAADHPGQQIELWFQDEARVGQKGRTGHRWWARGQRPRGLCDGRYDWTYLYAALRPATGEGFALVLPVVSTTAMGVFLAHFAATLAPDVHAVLVLDQAGWHGSRQLRVPGNVTLVPLPPYAPELNPGERVWLYLRERFLSHRLLHSNAAIVDACCQAWNALTPDRLRSLTSYPWIGKVTS
ncbi:MAG: IS630 family transposase [Roseomonas mucosa]|nr:IS630 family transposase [Roseomonas mucosa]